MTKAFAVLALCGAAFGQDAPAFEVASIKPAAPQEAGRVMVRMGGDPGRIDYKNVSLKNVLMRAYEVRSYQIGGPAWLDSARFDIVAKVPEGTPEEQVPAMLRNLLTERFKMAVHRETKEQSVYALVAGKNGLKLKKSEEEASPAGGPRRKGMMMFSHSGRLEAKGITMASFSDMLSNLLDRPVVDMTGAEGAYDIALDVSMEDLAGLRKMPAGPAHAAAAPDAAPPESTPAPSIFSAVQTLGLKLESRKAPVEFIVVDKADRVPTEN